MKYNYFIASRYRNKDIVLLLAKKIREKHKTVYCFIESDTSIKNVGNLNMDAQEAMKQFEALPDWKSHKKVFEVFQADMEALRNSNALILLLPAGKSAHIEAGVAYGLGKKLIVIGEQKETESLYVLK